MPAPSVLKDADAPCIGREDLDSVDSLDQHAGPNLEVIRVGEGVFSQGREASLTSFLDAPAIDRADGP